MASNEDDFDIVAPPLSDFIKGILKRYPDGQILKELIQNADDAGASVIKLLNDKSYYKPLKVINPSYYNHLILPQCQGPAICAYNDAKFEMCDWKGIRQPQRSHKSDSVLKVGQFGIGFISVYHITDMPWILSGNKLAVIEPTESLFNGCIRGIVKHRSGLHWNLDEYIHRVEISHNMNQFNPIEIAAQTVCPNRLGFVNKWHYDGTLFRLPLRTAESTLSKTVYNESMIEELFDSFSIDVEDILLFLTNLERIELLQFDCQRNVQTLFQSSISDKSIKTVRNERAQLMKKVNEITKLRENNVESTCDVVMNMVFNIDTKNAHQSLANQSTTWVVSHYLPKQSKAPKSWALEKHVNRLPWVALAAKATETVEGRIFCFLPFPNNDENMTGLPVHVNAYFGLDDNRRNLKWPSIDQTKDFDAQWNEALLKEVVPVAYVQLICFCVDKYGIQSYELWPDINKVHSRWKCILEPFLKLLFKQKVLKISCPNGDWSCLDSNVYVDILSNETVGSAVRRILNIVETPYVNVPYNVLEAVSYYFELFPNDVICIDETVVRNELRKIKNWNHIGSEDRLLLLQYFVESSSDFSTAATHIEGLPIIPLLNGEFGGLRKSVLVVNEKLYLASKEYQQLLPTLQHKIINTDALPTIVVDFLNDYTGKNIEISNINKINFPILLKQCLPKLWHFYMFGPFNASWFQKLWLHLETNYRYIKKFEGLSLLFTGGKPLTLPTIDNSLLFVDGSFSRSIQQMLLAANATSVPVSLLENHTDLKNYIQNGTAMGLLKLIQNCGSENINKILSLNNTYRKELTTFIAKNIYNITSDGLNVIRQLSLFKLLRYSSERILIGITHVSIDFCIQKCKNAFIINFNDLPVKVKSTQAYLDGTDSNHATLANWLGIKAITQAEVVYEMIENYNLTYNLNDFSTLMLWGLNYINTWSVKNKLRICLFVPSDDDKFYAPCELFDPNVKDLKNLFRGESGRFPSGEYTSSKEIEFLRGLGLRSSTNDITAREMMQTARIIDQFEFNKPCNKNIKLYYFNQMMQVNFKKLSQIQVRELQTLKLFEVKVTPPQGYPKNLPWYGTGRCTNLYSLSCLAEADCAMVAGSIVPIVKSTWSDELDIANRENIPIKCLVDHLKVISSNFQLLSTFEQETVLYECYNALSERPHNELEEYLVTKEFQEWIWTGKKFVEPEQVVISWSYYNNGLEPYMHCLPNFLREEHLVEFFCNFGVLKNDSLSIGKTVLKQIIRKHKYLVSKSETKMDFNLVRYILELVADNLEAEESEEEDENNDIQIPIKSNKTGLNFAPASHCKFNDSGDCLALLIGYNDDNDDDDDEIIIAHSDLPNELCSKLGATPLSNAVLDAEEFEQHESILQRLRNILDEYPAGATIFQELIQNADDAGAKEIGFLVDMRQNAQWRQSVLWNDSGMDKFQGPALWVFNDAVFSDDDFKNILCVGGATKRNTTKIGSFGVGFNSLYHVTDMPCFVSRNHYAILDPHKHCLPRSVGIKLNLQKKTKKLKQYAHQFLPYKDVFGCDLTYKPDGVSYPHTLFRLPLRDSDMAKNSQLSTIAYDLPQMNSLLSRFAQTANYVILFLPNIGKLYVDYLASNCENPEDKQPVFAIKKTINLLKINSLDSGTKVCSTEQLKLVEISLTSSKKKFSLDNLREGSCKVLWLLQWNLSAGKASELASSKEGQQAGLASLVAIAASINIGNKKKYKVETTSGLLFCYLPLPICTGLPFHLHAAFALGANRRHLWTENVQDESNLKTKWNEALKTDALVVCLIKLLIKLMCLDQSNLLQDYTFYSLWPIYDNVHQDFLGFVEGIYNRLCTTDKCLWKSDDGRWITFSQSRFLLLSTHWSKKFQDAAKQAVKSLLFQLEPDCSLVVISTDVEKSLEVLIKELFRNQSYDDKKFFTKLFFPNLKYIDFELANKILLEALTNNQAQNKYLKQLLQEYDCIPSSPDGRLRVKPRDLVCTKSEIYKLYSKNENKFAYGPFQESRIQEKLVPLGMKTVASSKMLLERAKTIQILWKDGLIEESKTRSKFIMEICIATIEESIFNEFLDIPFVFALEQPENWFLPWHKSSEAGTILYSPQELFPKYEKNVVCFVAPVSIFDKIGDSKHHIPADLILEQLKCLSQLLLKNFTTDQFEIVQEIVLSCLNALKLSPVEQIKLLLTEIKSLPILLFKSAAFISYSHVCNAAIQENYAPYLYSIKGSTYDKYSELLLQFGIKQDFNIEDYVEALQRMQKTFEKNILPSDELLIAIHLCRKISESDVAQIKEYKELPVPDINGVLYPVSNLTFWELDIKEVPKKITKAIRLCNRHIPRDIALKLGIQLQRATIAGMFYKPFHIGDTFGQHEELTTRIKNILDEYSSKSDVIKEMIQNADDAGATEIHFILDERQLATDSITLHDNWKYLQGPSLVVYNNKPFQEKDIEGIQKLGLGSKRSDPYLTGQFGIGFNTVYHLTDVPMFISNNDNLYVLDPHEMYLPTTTPDRKFGGKIELDKDFRDLYKNVLLGFKPVKDIKFEQATVFRLPLRRGGQEIQSLIADPIEPKELLDELKKFELVVEDYFYFLKSIRQIRISYVNKEGKVNKDVCYFSEISKNDGKKKKEFLQILKNNEQLSEDVTVEYRMAIGNSQRSEKSNWLIMQRLSCLKNDVPTEIVKLRETGKFVTSPLVGIAVPLCNNTKSKCIYTTLPLPECSHFPVHLNGKFMLNQGRKQLYLLTNDDSYKKQWNEYLIVKVLAPLYVESLKCMKKILIEDWTKTPSNENKMKLRGQLIRRYQYFLPSTYKQMETGSLLLKEVYNLLHRNNLKLLFGTKIDHSKQELLWLAPSDGVIDTFENVKSELNKLTEIDYIRKILEIDYIRKILEIVHMPTFHLGFNWVVKDICKVLEVEQNEINPQAVCDHLKKIEDRLLLASDNEKLPIKLDKSTLTKPEIHHCLNYIMKSDSESIILDNVPLLLTADGMLRRFSSEYELYKHKFFHLLPSQGSLFCSSDINDDKIPETYCKKFNVSALAKHLLKELPELYGDCWKKPFPNNMSFINNILKYLVDSVDDVNDQKSVLAHVQCLHDWALIPVSVYDDEDKSEEYLVTLKNTSLVIFPVNTNDTKKGFYPSLRKLGIPFIEVASLLKENEITVNTNIISFFTNLCACSLRPKTIVNILHSTLKNEIENANFDRIILNDEDKLVLLNFIISKYSDDITAEGKETIDLIKMLPLFKTLEGNFINMENEYNYIVCEIEIECTELNKLRNEMKVIFLNNKLIHHKTFCKNLSISVVSSYDVLYKDYIIPCMASFSLKAIVKHLYWIHQRSYKFDVLFFEILGCTPFIQVSTGNFKAIRDLYSNVIEKEFAFILPEDSFLPREFSNSVPDFAAKNWHSFLKELGLKCEFSASVFLELARKLETEEQNEDNVTLKKKSKALVDYFNTHYLRMHKEDETFLHSVSLINFVYAHAVSEELNFLHEQPAKLIGLMNYRNRPHKRHEKICWTVSKLLPDWSLDGMLNSHLLKTSEPMLDDVIQHTNNVCNRLQKLKFEENTTININGKKEIKLLRAVLEDIFKFVSRFTHDNQKYVIDALKHVPCVLVEDGRLLVCPHQVVFQNDIAECPPFLYILPDNLHSHLNFLKRIGLEMKVTYSHYSSALSMFYSTYGLGPYLNPNLMSSLQTAYIGFLNKIIQSEPVKETETILYLPDEKSCLQKSTEIFVFTDSLDIESLSEISEKKWNTLMFKDTDEPIEKYANALLRLPMKIRPKSYDNYIITSISENCEICQLEEFCNNKFLIEKLFTNPLFPRIVVKIINLFNLNANDRADINKMTIFFNSVTVTCYEVLKLKSKNIRTKKLLNEKNITIFTQENEVMLAHDYVDVRNDFVDILLTLVNVRCPFKSDTTKCHFRSIFGKLDIYRAEDSLNKIAKENLKKKDIESDSYLPRLGSIIPDDAIALLDQNQFNYYKKLDYIACAHGQDEENDDDDTCYIYARIIEEITKNSAEAGGLIKWFRIDIGDAKPIEMSTLYIYKFISSKILENEIQNEFALVCLNVVDDNEREVNKKFSQSLQEAMDNLTEKLEMMWTTMLEADRKRAIKRLYLFWHPDKNPQEHKEFCDEMFKYLKNEIYRLTNGLPRKQRKEAKPSKSWDDTFDRWNNRAGQDKRKRENYNRRARNNWNSFKSSCNSDTPPSFSRNSNQTARIWCRQAKCDLDSCLYEAARDEPCYEWVFYKCYQVARKSLTAMLYLKLRSDAQQSTSLMELARDVLLVDKGVDEFRTTEPSVGKTNHQNYQQHRSDCSGEIVIEVVTKLLELAKRCLRNYESEE